MISRLWILVAASFLSAAAPAPSEEQMLSIEAQSLRSTKGNLLICVTRLPQYFPDCSRDPDRRHFNVAVRKDAIALGLVPPGDYAIAIIHDENANGKLDTFAGIPREGVGFSRNPTIRFGAPSYKSAHFAMGNGAMRQVIKVKYFL